jgi:hypothetical protein
MGTSRRHFSTPAFRVGALARWTIRESYATARFRSNDGFDFLFRSAGCGTGSFLRSIGFGIRCKYRRNTAQESDSGKKQNATEEVKVHSR